MSRRILALVLALLMTVSALALASCGSKTPTPSEEAKTQTPGTTTIPATKPAITEETSAPITGEIINPFENEQIGNFTKKEHKPLTEIPTSATLVGSYSLPPIDNQGGVGSCASEAVAYMQFSNAVSRYLHSIDEKSTFNAKDSAKYRFSPKFTYLFSSAGTAWVYNILMDHGCATTDWSMFHKDGGGGSQIKNGASFYQDSLKWDVAKDELYKSLQFRITNYEQIWCTKDPWNGKITTSDAGRELVTKIKEAIASGNVVVTGGYVGRWQYTRVLNGGTLGKTSESIICYSTKEGDGGHQVSIVGYDDDITCKVGGQILKGAFLVANSWGTSYENKGYVWVAYDALNTVSEYEELNDEKYARGWTFDQFCFTYWDSDITAEVPELMAEVEIETTDRESFYILLSREDKAGIVETHMPYLFKYGAGDANIHDSYGVTNFAGEVGTGKADTGYFTLSYSALTKYIPAGKSVNDFIWGIKIASVSSKTPINVKSVKLVNAKHETIKEIVPTGEDATLQGNSIYYQFRMSESIANYSISGQYAISQNDVILNAEKLAITTTKEIVKTAVFDFIWNVEENTYTIKKQDGNYVLDISGKKIAPDVEVKFNAGSATRETQSWKFLDNGDGTFSIYLSKTDDSGRWYAVGLKDGKTVLVTGADVQKYGKFNFDTTASESVEISVEKKGEEFAVSVTNNTSKEIASISVVDAAGNTVKDGIKAGEETTIGKLAAGEYKLIVEHPSLKYVYDFIAE